MCISMYNSLVCSLCDRAHDDMNPTISAQRVFKCTWAKNNHVQPINCLYLCKQWSGIQLHMDEPCEVCMKQHRAGAEKARRWVEEEKRWREQNPLALRMGEDIPEADRGWRSPFDLDNDASITSNHQAQRSRPRTRSSFKTVRNTTNGNVEDTLSLA